MDLLTQIECYSEQLEAAVKEFCNSPGVQPLCDSIDDKELARLRTNILATMAGIKKVICQPTDFLQGLACQMELLACLQWLCEFQLLTCIPPEVSVPIKDVADLAGVPECQLRRVVRMTATCGFLREPQAGHVAHTPLSCSFVDNQSLIDAVMFLAESASLAGLKMSSATQRFGASRRPNESAYNVAMDTARPFHMIRQERPKLGRQWSAYLHYAAGLHTVEKVIDVLSQLHWSNLSGNACVVEVGAKSTAMARALANRYQGLRIIVQINHGTNQSSSTMPDAAGVADTGITASGWGDLVGNGHDSNKSTTSNGTANNARVTVSYRVAGTPQPVTDAAVYILHLPAVLAHCRAQLQEYLGVLRANGGIMLVLTSHLLPEPGSLSDSQVEAVARTRDLNMLQLANEGEMELADLLGIIDTIRDSVGRLVVVDRLCSSDGLVVVLAVKHRDHTDNPLEP